MESLIILNHAFKQQAINRFSVCAYKCTLISRTSRVIDERYTAVHMSAKPPQPATRDARTGEALVLKFTGALNEPTVKELLELDSSRVAGAWLKVVQSQKSHRVRVRALRQIRRALIARGPPWSTVANALPRRVMRGILKYKPDPLLRQRRIIEEDAIPARIATPWVREMLRFILHHPVQGFVGENPQPLAIKNGGWRTSATAHQCLSMVHRFTRCSGLLNFPDFAAFRRHIAQMSTEAIRDMCALFADRLCASSKSAHAYVRVFNMLFVDVFPVVDNSATMRWSRSPPCAAAVSSRSVSAWLKWSVR